MVKKVKLNQVNLSYFFSVSFLSLLSVFVFFVVPLFSSSNPSSVPGKDQVALKPEFEEKIPEIMVQIGDQDFPADFFQELKFGETKTGEISSSDQDNPIALGGKVDGFKFVLPVLDDYQNVELYFRSCPDDGDQDHFNNCLAFSSFTEGIWLFNSEMNQIGSGDTRIDFDSHPVTDDRVYYVLVGTDNNATGHYKITLDYEQIPVNFKVKFNGINDNRGEIKVKAKLYLIWANNRLWDIGEISLAGNDQGVYQGGFGFSNVGFDFANYTLLIKGPKHLQKRFAGLSFAKGQVVDLTADLLEPGDLPLPQDGKVDSKDFNFLWDHRGSTNAGDLAIGDLNLDGTVNMGDVNLLLQTLQTKEDEEGW